MKEHEDVTEFFDSRVSDYEHKHYTSEQRTFMTVRQERVLEFIDALALKGEACALDAGCGPGYLLRELAKRNFIVSAMDASPGMLKSAEEKLKALNLPYNPSFKVGDIELLPYPDESFDLVCSTGVIEYLKNDTQVLAEMFRVLKPGGYLVLPVTNLWSPVNLFDPIIEAFKRTNWLRKPFNSLWQKLGHGPIIARHFAVRKHSPSAFKQSLKLAKFCLEDETYFHFLPWPRPINRLLPKISNYLGNKMEKLGNSRLGGLGEGYLAICRKK
jgi:ubiquinone/menaquinone biosynthesis C-methylase UbiE